MAALYLRLSWWRIGDPCSAADRFSAGAFFVDIGLRFAIGPAAADVARCFCPRVEFRIRLFCFGPLLDRQRDAGLRRPACLDVTVRRPGFAGIFRDLHGCCGLRRGVRARSVGDGTRGCGCVRGRRLAAGPPVDRPAVEPFRACVERPRPLAAIGVALRHIRHGAPRPRRGGLACGRHRRR